MKKILFSAAILLGCLSCRLTQAQVRFNVNVNIGSQPAWGPVGYDHVDYYYIPDIDTYYSVPTHQYIYMDNGRWIRTVYLPPRYSNYDIYHGYKVVVNEPNPWYRHNEYRQRYYNYRGRRDQVIIGQSHDERYRNHWDNGNHNGWENGRGNPHREDRWHGDGGDREHGDHGDRGHGDHGERGHGDHGDRGHGDHGDK